MGKTQKFLRMAAMVLAAGLLVPAGCDRNRNLAETGNGAGSSLAREDDEGSIRIYYFYSPPHIFEDENGELTGAVYDFIEEGIGPAMNTRFIWNSESTTIPRQTEILGSEARTAAAILSISPERVQIMAYSAEPYFVDNPVLVVAADSSLRKITSVDDIMGIRIGYAERGYLVPLMRNEGLEFDLISNSDYHKTNLIKLDLGRVDAVYGPGRTTLLYNIRQLGLEKSTRVLDLPDSSSTTYYVVFSKLSPELADRYDAAFREIDGVRLYREILERYIGELHLNDAVGD